MQPLGTRLGYYRLQKWAAIALARDLVPARGLDPWRRPKGSWALGTRMGVYNILVLLVHVPVASLAFARVIDLQANSIRSFIRWLVKISEKWLN